MKTLIPFFCLILLFSCKTSKLVLSPEQEAQLSLLKRDVNYLSSDELEGRLVGTKGELLAATYIAERFEKLGLQKMDPYNSFYQEYTVHKKPNPHSLTPTGDVESRNVIALIDNKADNYVIIGAHYDHLGYGHFGTLWDGDPEIHNGADDNASGTSLLLSLAEDLQKGPKNNNYIFMAFSGEEMGLWGSNYWTKHPNIDLSKVNYMINMDMVGRLNEERALALYGTGTSPKWEDILDPNNTSGFKLVKKESGIGPSDHSSFYTEDIPVLHFFTGHHEDYHKPSDDADKINYKGIVEVGDYIMRIITDADDEGKLVFSKTKDESEDVPDFKVTLGVIPDYLFDGIGMRIDGIKEGRPASNASLKKGDIVVKIGTLEITDMGTYMQALSNHEPGETTNISIIRNEQQIDTEVTF